MTGIPSHVRSEYPLSPFYKKYLHAYGIPVISSENATDAALKRTCYVVVFLLADREDIRRSVYKRRGRAGVIAATEGVTSIPEHSWLADWWNGRARGLGGTVSLPISTCEYLLFNNLLTQTLLVIQLLIHESMDPRNYVKMASFQERSPERVALIKRFIVVVKEKTIHNSFQLSI